MKKCLFCRKPITGVRKTKKYCSDSCRAQFSRIKRFISAQQQGDSETGEVTLDTSHWCFEHEMEKEYCRGFKHTK